MRHQRPDGPRHLVGQRHRDQHAGQPCAGLSGSRAATFVTELAPIIRSLRKLRSPIFVVRSSRSLPPLECCRGTRPSQAAKSRPRRNVLAAGASATSAVAITDPTPGMVISRFATGSVLAWFAISRSRRAICD